MNWFDFIDIYCERVSESIWNEPVNTLTNLVFFIVAWCLYKQYRERGGKDVQARRLLLLIVLVGIGSTLFHIFANRLALWADIIPIILFVMYYFWVALQRFLHWPLQPLCVALCALAFTSSAMFQIPAPYNFNGSIPYFPCLIALVLIGHRLKAIHHEATLSFFIAATWFGISLFFRIIDMEFCRILFTGTHFLWHLCNGMVIYIITKAIIEKPPLTLR
jgi:hypothetical protein